jgi:hypothetical protein
MSSMVIAAAECLLAMLTYVLATQMRIGTHYAAWKCMT